MSTSGVVVREAAAGAAELLARLIVAVQQVHHDALPHRFKAPHPNAAAPFFAAKLARAEITILLAERDGAALGYAMVEEVRSSESALTFPRQPSTSTT